MNAFVDAVKSVPVPSQTENGMAAYVNSLKASTDLFYIVGSNRGKDLTSQFESVIQESEDLAMRMALWVRDIRGGAGERQMFRSFLTHLEAYHPDLITQTFLEKIAEVGRFDDLLTFNVPAIRAKAIEVIHSAIKAGNGLAAKWLPRKGDVALELRHAFGMTPKLYRKTLVNLTKVVETKMCAQEWGNINYSHVPSKAMTLYTKAFFKHDPDGIAKYKEDLKSGKAKINAAAVYPYNVVQYISSDRELADKMWDSLPNYMTDAAVLPMVDVSGSMTIPASGVSGVSCMDVALSLGLYCSDKNKGPYKDMFLTFTHDSKIHILKGSLSEKIKQMKMDVGYDTNFESAFKEVLRVAKAKNVPQEDMPKIILALSDMQFNASSWSFDERAIDMISRMYQDAGYKMPALVFWNLAGGRISNQNSPVTFDEKGTAMVSGFSPSIMKAILAADLEQFTPENIMKTALLNERYDWK